MLAEQTLVIRGGILTAAIRMVQEPGPWVPIRQRHGERLLGQLHGQPVAHRPADHEARVQIEDHGEVEPALCRPYVGEVPGPHPIRRLDRELAIEGVGRHGEPMMGLCCGSPLLHGLGPDAVLAHQPGHAMFTDAVSLLKQGVPDAGTAVGFAGLLMDHPDGQEHGPGGHRTGTLRPCAPRVIARSREGEGAAHEPDRIATVMLFLQGLFFFFFLFSPFLFSPYISSSSLFFCSFFFFQGGQSMPRLQEHEDSSAIRVRSR